MTRWNLVLHINNCITQVTNSGFNDFEKLLSYGTLEGFTPKCTVSLYLKHTLKARESTFSTSGVFYTRKALKRDPTTVTVWSCFSWTSQRKKIHYRVNCLKNSKLRLYWVFRFEDTLPIQKSVSLRRGAIATQGTIYFSASLKWKKIIFERNTKLYAYLEFEIKTILLCNSM